MASEPVKHNKHRAIPVRALWAVLIVLVMLVPLIGGTYAWFAATAKTGEQSITSDSLEVKMLTNDGYLGTGQNGVKDADGTAVDLTADNLGVGTTGDYKPYEIADNKGLIEKFLSLTGTPDTKVVKPLIIQNDTKRKLTFRITILPSDDAFAEAVSFDITKRKTDGTYDATATSMNFSLTQLGETPLEFTLDHDETLVLMFDVGVLPSAGDFYQGREVSFNLLLTAVTQDSKDNIHKVTNEWEFKQLFSSNSTTGYHAAPGDTVLIMNNITFTDDIVIDRPVNIDLLGNTLDFATGNRKLTIDFTARTAVFDGSKTNALMTVGSDAGGAIQINGNQVDIQNAGRTVFTWYAALGAQAHPVTAGSVLKLSTIPVPSGS